MRSADYGCSNLGRATRKLICDRGSKRFCLRLTKILCRVDLCTYFQRSREKSRLRELRPLSVNLAVGCNSCETVNQTKIPARYFTSRRLSRFRGKRGASPARWVWVGSCYRERRKGDRMLCHRGWQYKSRGVP